MVTIGAASQEDIVLNPRAYALLSYLKTKSAGQIQTQTLSELVKKTGGDENQVNGNAEISFKEFAALFSKAYEENNCVNNCFGYAAHNATDPLVPYRFKRENVEPDQVKISILFAGICHSDIHQVLGEWNNSTYPMVPGHEIVGVVVETGADASEWKNGDIVGVGCMVDCKCRHTCQNCLKNEEQYCLKGSVSTYNGVDVKGNPTQGGYSSHIICHKKFVLKMPVDIDLAAATPLLCAGITTYSPMKYFGVDKPGMNIGVMGLGGLGHMAVKFGKAFGCNVTVLSTSPSKKDEAINGLKADAFLNTKDSEAVKAAGKSLDAIIDTVSADHDIGGFLSLLKTDGKFILVGAPPKPFPIGAFQLIANRITLGGSLIGGIKETQEMLDFCGEKNITCDIEVISADYVNTAYERALKSDVKYRFVIDIAATLVN